jgi:hypothetical protein
MKISITTNNKVFSVEDEFGFDSVSVDEAVEMFKGLLVCAGFHPSNVDDAFNTDYTWFTEEERNDNMQGHKKYNYTDPDDPMYLAQEEDYMKAHNEGYAKGWDEALHNKKVQEFQDNLYKQPLEEF